MKDLIKYIAKALVETGLSSTIAREKVIRYLERALALYEKMSERDNFGMHCLVNKSAYACLPPGKAQR